MSNATPLFAGTSPHVFTTTQVVKGLLHHQRQWEGKTVLVRGRFVGYPGLQCVVGKSCPFRGGLSDSGLSNYLLTLRVTPATESLPILQPATYRVRLHLGRYGATLQPEGYLLGRIDRAFLTLYMTPPRPRLGDVLTATVITAAPRYCGININYFDAAGRAHQVFTSGDFRARRPSRTWIVNYQLRATWNRAEIVALCWRRSSTDVVRTRVGFRVRR